MDTTPPSPPFVDVPGIANFRGIAGSHAGPGLVFRSADPSKASQAGLEKMSKDLGKVGLFESLFHACSAARTTYLLRRGPK